MNSSPYQSPFKQVGVALISVLAVAAVMVVLMSIATQMLQNRLLLAVEAKKNVKALAKVDQQLNELIYLVVSQRRTAAGISQGEMSSGFDRADDGRYKHAIVGDELRVDGKEVNVPNGITFSIQNETGLIPVNSGGASSQALTQFWLKRWMQGYGLLSTQQNRIADTLYDYADANDWQKPGGAEASEFAKRGLPLPPNFLLQSCNELQRIFDLTSLSTPDPRWREKCSLSRSSILSLNAVPISLWRILWPMSANKVASARENGVWFTDSRSALSAEPSLINIPEELYRVIGGNSYYINVRSGNVEKRVHLMAGDGANQPFSVKVAPIPDTES